jgi:ectoine hydroxylase-related dioxygenase (phytanoyl-CoA dioxygenase family)
MQQTDNGYSIFERVFERSEMMAALRGLEQAAITRTKAGARHVLSVPVVRQLATDSRLLPIASRFVGPDAVPFRATLFDKSQASNWLVVWHQDTALPLRGRSDSTEWGSWSLKSGVLYAHAPAWALASIIALRVHLDDSTHTNGPLRVLPDTHTCGVVGDHEIERLAVEIEAVDCVVSAGGVVAMRPLTVHASSKSRDDRPRRVLHIEYAAGINLAPGIELAVG